MVGPVGKTPRHKLTARKRQLCLDLRRRDRRVRREESKEEAKEEAAPKKTGAPVKKKAAKETAAKTSRAPAKTWSGVVAASKEADEEAGGECIGRLGDKGRVYGGARDANSYSLTGLPPLRYLLWFYLALQRANDLQYKFPGSGILQDDASEEEPSSDEDGRDAAHVAPVAPACVVDGDPNMMAARAEECTGLNSDEDPDLQEKPEKDDDASYDDDSVDDWDGDWDLGNLTDEIPMASLKSFRNRFGQV
ncbi:hypothetical protein PInf_022282 [Phytophthora infestans]|nr:hypothetical protein PInf_022282 [Phytophthora infestans]